MKKTIKARKSASKNLMLKSEKVRVLSTEQLEEVGGGRCMVVGTQSHCGVDCNSTGG